VATALEHRPCVGELAGDVEQLPVHLLGDAGQDTEGLLGSKSVSFHEDALGLPDDVPVAHADTQVRLVLRAGQRHCGVTGEQETDVLALVIEGARVREYMLRAPSWSPATNSWKHIMLPTPS
jgi:hypothetical protein